MCSYCFHVDDHYLDLMQLPCTARLETRTKESLKLAQWTQCCLVYELKAEVCGEGKEQLYVVSFQMAIWIV